MKKSILLIVFITIVFYSCNNKESARENLQNSISEFSEKQTNLEVTSYYPESYTEIKTDSIISNTFKVSIKNYSRIDSKIVMSTKKTEKKTTLNYHRVFESEIHISSASKTIFNTTMRAVDFKNNSQSDFWNHATLEHVWVNQENSNSNELNLNISIINTNSKAYKLYELVINTEGQQELYLIEEHS